MKSFVCTIFACAFVVSSLAHGEEMEPPFPNVSTVPEPFDSAIMDFYQQVKGKVSNGNLALGKAGYANALRWPKTKVKKVGALDGEWHSRWKGGNQGNQWLAGTAQIKVVKTKTETRVFILYEDPQFKGIVDAKIIDDKWLVGKYLDLKNKQEIVTHKFTGLIVNNQRIDGQWDGGSFDFRRLFEE